jgi:hypothetical protein
VLGSLCCLRRRRGREESRRKSRSRDTPTSWTTTERRRRRIMLGRAADLTPDGETTDPTSLTHTSTDTSNLSPCSTLPSLLARTPSVGRLLSLSSDSLLHLSLLPHALTSTSKDHELRLTRSFSRPMALTFSPLPLMVDPSAWARPSPTSPLH